MTQTVVDHQGELRAKDDRTRKYSDTSALARRRIYPYWIAIPTVEVVRRRNR